MSDAPACKVPIPWYVHPYFAALLSGGTTVLSSLILKRLDPQGAARVAAGLMAVPPSGFLVWTFVRWIRGLDELEHRIVFHAVSFSFVASILLMIGLEGLEKARVLTGLGWESAWEAMVFLYVLGYALAKRRYA
ncbi:MAG TPA: hypothetical protein VJT67_09140 [Longimicrobiaceae bacterium]|nr:hypothetical protein [Longimicrobiaceae bacterium]